MADELQRLVEELIDAHDRGLRHDIDFGTPATETERLMEPVVKKLRELIGKPEPKELRQ